MLSALVPQLRTILSNYDNLEIEAKYGYYTAGGFRSNVPYIHYARLHNYLVRPQSGADAPVKEESSVAASGDIRRVTIISAGDEPEEIRWERKIRIQDFDLAEYDMRLSVSQEIPIAPQGSFQPETLRERTRTSYDMDGGVTRVDLTEVVMSIKGRTDIRYEVEVEFLGQAQDLPQYSARLAEIFRHLRGTQHVFTTTEKNKVNADIGRILTGENYINKAVLVEARNIKRNDLVWGGIAGNKETGYRRRQTRLPPTNYLVTFKADGLRKMLIIHTTGIWLIYPPYEFNLVIPRDNNNPQLLKLLDSFTGTVCDGELVVPRANVSVAHWFLVFDCIAQRGNNGIQNQPYSQRRQYIEVIARTIRTPSLTVDLKETREITTADSFFQLVSQFLSQRDNLGFKEDGLLFFPADVPYNPGSSKLPLYQRRLTLVPDVCKYKEMRNITIDFSIRLVEPGIIDVYSYDSDRNELVPFRGNDINPFTPDMIDQTSEITRGLRTGTVVEFEWDATANLLRPRLVRREKGSPNRLDIAVDNWTDLHNPITEDEITGRNLTMAYNYHKRIKKGLFSLLPRNSSILDIGTGLGGDLTSMQQLNGPIVAVEPDTDKLVKLRQRISTFNLEDRVTVVPVGGEDTTTIVNSLPSGRVDTIALMLSLSFFWSSDSHLEALVRTIVSTLKPGGQIIFLTIDGNAVQQLFEPAFHASFRTDIELAQGQFHLYPPAAPPYGRALDVTLPRAKTVGEKQREYLVHLTDLTTRLQQYGIELNEVHRAEGEKLLSHDNSVYSSLYSYGYYTATTNLPSLTGNIVLQPPPDPNSMSNNYMSAPLPQVLEQSPVTSSLPSPSELPTPPSPITSTPSLSSSPSPKIPIPVPRDLTLDEPQGAHAVQHDLLPWLPVSHTTVRGGIRVGPAVNDDTYEPLTCSWYDNLVRIATIGDGSCFIHSVLKAIDPAYVASRSARERIASAEKTRRDLANLLPIENSQYPGYSYWETAADGSFARLAWQEMANPVLTEILGVDYSLSGLQALFNSDNYLGDEVYQYISDALNVDIYVLRGTINDLYPHLNTRQEDRLRAAIVIMGNTEHYEVVALQQSDGLQTLFQPQDDLVRALIALFRGEEQTLFDPRQSLINSASDACVAWIEARYPSRPVPKAILDDYFLQFEQLASTNDTLYARFAVERTAIYLRTWRELTLNIRGTPDVVNQVNELIPFLTQPPITSNDINELQAIVRSQADSGQTLIGIILQAESSKQLPHYLVQTAVNLLT